MNNIIEKISGNTTLSFIALLVFLVYLFAEVIVLRKRDGFSMTSTPLTQQPLFWASIRIPIFSFLYFGAFSWAPSSFRFDHEGFSNFIDISKLPLGLLSLSIPFVAIINNMHRTIQTDEQIQQTKKKNKIDEFYAHQKNHIEYFSSIINGTLTFNIAREDVRSITLPPDNSPTEETKTFKVESPFKLYKKTFSYASPDLNDFSVNLFLLNRIKDKWAFIDNNLLLLKNTSDDMKSFEIASTIELYLKLIAAELFFSPYPVKYTYTLTTTRFKYATIFESESEFKMALRLYLKLTREYLDIIKVDDVPNEIHRRIMLYAYSSDSRLPFDEGWAFMKSQGDAAGFDPLRKDP